MAIHKINGRKYFFGSITKIEKDPKPGVWKILSSKGTFYISGGKKLGGSAKEWFLDNPDLTVLNDYIKTKSMIEALNLIENM